MTLIGMTTTTVFLTSTILTMETVALLISMQMIISHLHTIQLLMAVTSTELKTALLTPITQQTTGTSCSGTILSRMSYLITTDTMLQLLRWLRELFQSFTGLCSHDGRLTMAAMIGILMQMETRSPTALISIKMLTDYPIGGIKTKVTMEYMTSTTSRWAVRLISLHAVGLQETLPAAMFADTVTLWLTTCLWTAWTLNSALHIPHVLMLLLTKALPLVVLLETGVVLLVHKAAVGTTISVEMVL